MKKGYNERNPLCELAAPAAVKDQIYINDRDSSYHANTHEPYKLH